MLKIAINSDSQILKKSLFQCELFKNVTSIGKQITAEYEWIKSQQEEAKKHSEAKEEEELEDDSLDEDSSYDSDES